MWFYVIILFIIFFVYTLYRLSYFYRFGVANVTPLPIFGNMLSATFAKKSLMQSADDHYKIFKDERYFGMFQYHVPSVVLRDPELIRNVMVRDFHAFVDRGVHIDPKADPLFGFNLINVKGSQWKSLRGASTPAFSLAKFRKMTPLMIECCNQVMKHLETMVGTGQDIDTDDVATPYVNDVIASCAFGFSVDTLSEPNNCIFRLGQTALVTDTSQILKLFGYANFPNLMKLLGVRIISKPDTEMFVQLFKSAMQARRENKVARRPDFIQAMVDALHDKTNSEELKNGENNGDWTQKFTDEQLIAQAVLFYVAGYDTTANLINFFLYEMAMNEDIQQKLYEEIQSISEEDDLYEAIQKLEYLEMCMSETLRKWPMIGIIDRSSVASYDFGITSKGSSGQLIADPGIHVWIPIWSLHRDPKHWPKPDQFDPDRFSTERKRDIVPFTYLPFGAGPRQCIGTRFAMITNKIFLVKCLQRFQIRSGKRTPQPIRIAPMAFVSRPDEPFSVYMEPRL